MNAQTLFATLDLLGVFVFAISGAAAALQRRLDLFGVVVMAFITACGGGLVRDVCLGALPPAGLSHWQYLMAALAAAAITVRAYPLVQRLAFPVLLFDAMGLGLFAVTGSHKALQYSDNLELAIVLGMITATGGGVARDVLLNRVPVILQKEIYACAALLGAAIEVLGERYGGSPLWLPWLGMAACFGVRLLALRYGWHMRWVVRPRAPD